MITTRTYVNFQQAELLKEKGWDINTGADCWLKTFDGTIIHNKDKNGSSEHEHERAKVILMQPEQWMVIEWLRVKHGIHLFLDYTFYDGFHYGVKFCKKNGDVGEIWAEGEDTDIDGSDTPQQAYSTAIDYVLKELI